MWLLLPGIMTVMVVMGVAFGVLNQIAGPDADAPVRIDVLRIALTAAAGTAGLLALLLAFRRQRSAEIADAHGIADATERRITELYANAVDQLGSDKATNRLAGLYSLERLGQDSPHLRQTIFNVICGYLRMPFVSHVDSPPLVGDSRSRLSSGEYDNATHHNDIERMQEREVRLTAQRILAEHLRVDDLDIRKEEHWSGLDLDLTGAVLIDFDLSACRAQNMRFDEVVFVGKTTFADSIFVGTASFRRAKFVDYVSFRDATFARNAQYENAVFDRSVGFRRVKFEAEVAFGGATCKRGACFDSAVFRGNAGFHGTIFKRAVYFDNAVFAARSGFRAKFEGKVSFRNAAFDSCVSFSSVSFNGDTTFENSVFGDRAFFAETVFNRDADFNGVVFQHDADWVGVAFNGHARLSEVYFGGKTRFVGARFHQNCAFRGTVFQQDVEFDRVVFSRRTRFVSTKFATDASFSGASFLANSGFDRTVFCGSITFRSTFFAKMTGFRGVAFVGEADFQGAEFGASVHFDGARVFLGVNRMQDVSAWVDDWIISGVNRLGHGVDEVDKSSHKWGCLVRRTASSPA
jgi:uncharacterized protein YjbI with pentapeptide repeats